MATQNLIDEKHITNAFVFLDANEVQFVSLKLDQEIGEHHRFRIVFDYDSIQQSFMGNISEQINLIGKTVKIELQQGDNNGGAYEFRGIVDNIDITGSNGENGHLVVSGASTTILLERGKRLDIFSDMSLREIAEQACDDLRNQDFSLVNKPLYDVPLSFVMQYHENDWEFLQRLSAISGEQLIYTGWDLVFGNYKDWPVTDVMYDKEIYNIQFGSRLLSNTFTYYEYLSDRDEILEQESPQNVENSNSYLDAASDRAAELVISHPVLVPSPLPVEDIGALDDMGKRRKTSTASRSIYIKGESKTCAPRIGRLLNFMMPEDMSGASELGVYRVIKVTHELDENHRYECKFEAVPADLKFTPVPELKMPVASSLAGVVVNTKDPDSLGRVCVEFPFARDRGSFTWMRVMSPSAGGLTGQNNSGGVIDKNRGMVFIPEDGDQVMVGFEFGDPNRPYVMGSMFHGNNSLGGGDSNAIKSIMTRSGHTIKLDDTEGSEKITINDNGGSIITFDTQAKSLIISSFEDINISAKNINITAEENITIAAKENIAISAEGDLNEQAAGNIAMQSDGDTGINSTGALTIESTTDTTVIGVNTIVEGAASAELNSVLTKVTGDMIEVTGSLVKLN